jgi:hypothetical protein
MVGLTNAEISMVVERYIGVQSGYLGDFSYRTHRQFYFDLDIEVDPDEIAGTTRVRFIEILRRSQPDVQAKILRGILERYPVGSGASGLRTQTHYERILTIARRLEGIAVASVNPSITSVVVERAIADAETLLYTSGATSGVDRVHTALHGYLRAVCVDAGITHGVEPSLQELFALLRQRHPRLQDLGEHAAEITQILRAFSKILDALNVLRNQGSVAHPNPVLLDQEEALLAINAARTLLGYLDARFSPRPG